MKMLLAVTRPPRQASPSRGTISFRIFARACMPQRETEKPRADHPQELRT